MSGAGPCGGGTNCRQQPNPSPGGATHRVAGAPVQEVEVVVINQVGGVQDAVGLLGDGAEGLLDARARVGGVQRSHVVLVALCGRGGLLLEGQDAGCAVLAQVGRQLLLVLQLRWGRGEGGGGGRRRRAGETTVGDGCAATIWAAPQALVVPLPRMQCRCIASVLSVGGAGRCHAPAAGGGTHLGGGHGVHVLYVLGLAGHVVVGHIEVAGAAVGDEAVHLRAGAGGERWWPDLCGQRLACPAPPRRSAPPSPCQRSWSAPQTSGAFHSCPR